MKRSKILAAVLLGCLLVGVIALALRVTMTGSGSLGGVLPGWSILESCTPSMPGDSRGSLGGASFRAHAKSDSRFVADNTVDLATSNGDWLGRINEVQVGARADVSAVGALQFLNVDKTMPPVWFNDAGDILTGEYGSGTGQFGGAVGIASDPADDSFYVTSNGTVDGADRYKVIKFDSTGAYVLEFGAQGTGNGQFSGAMYVAVSPVDGTVYVTDVVNRRVEYFNSSGTYQGQWGSAGSGNGQFGSGSMQIAVDSTGAVYVADRGNARIQKFTSTGTYTAQVAVAGYSLAPYSISVGSGDIIYVTAITALTTGAVGTIRSYNTSLVLQSTITPTIPAGSQGGIFNIVASDTGTVWAHWPATTYIIEYDSAGAEVSRWQSLYPLASDTNSNFGLGLNGSGHVLVLFRDNTRTLATPYGGYLVTSFDYSPVLLSAAIEQYMEACDLTLNGWTLDYQGSVDPEVIIPGWSGNVWANLKELFATHSVELVYDASTQTIIIRDIGSATTTFTNIEPATTQPVNLTGGRVVDVIYQQPRAGGGVVWDAATENESVSIATGARQTRIFSTDNHPAELAQPVPTDTLPIQPGQYYVVDSTGAAVPAATWLAAGGNITLTVGSSPGTISAFIKGPASNPTGFTGPYSFATGNTPDDIPALSIVGNGTFTTPTLFSRAGSQGQPFNSPFMDTRSRLLQRGHFASRRMPNVVLDFIVPTADLPLIGQAPGTIFPYEQSRYRILEVQRGNLKSRISAERYVTAADHAAVWAGETAADHAAYWADYSAADHTIQPLRHA